MTDGQAPGGIPFVGSWGVLIRRNTTPFVVDHVGASKQGLVSGEIEIHSRRVRVQTNWRAGIESISLRVHAVTDAGIVGGIFCRGARKCRQSSLVQTLNVGKNLSKIRCTKSH